MSYDPPRPYRPHLVSPTSYDSLRAPPSITTWSDASISSLDQSKERLPPQVLAAPSPLQHYAPPPPPQAPLPPLPRGGSGRPSTLQKQPPPPPPSSSATRGPPPPRPPPLHLSGQVAPPPMLPQQQQHVAQEKPDMYSVKMGGTGVLARKESSSRKTKRISLMIISGLIVSGIIALIVLGCKKML